MSNWRRRGSKVQLTVYMGRSGDKMIRKTKTVPYVSDKQAELDWLEFSLECDKGSGITLSELTRRVYNYLEPRCTRQTLHGYRAAIKCIDAIDMPLKDLKPLDIQDWIDSLDLADKTRKNYLSYLKRCLKLAVGWELIDRDPSQMITVTCQLRPVRTLSQAELATFLAALRNEPLNYKTAVYLGLCGLRRGEVCGLDCKDYDPASMTLSISKALYIDGPEVYVGSPKTRASVRSIIIPYDISILVAELAKDKGPLIKGAKGSYMYPDNLWHWLHRFEVKHDLPEVSFHSLRHTCAAMLLESGMSPASVSSILGHSNISTTLDIYGYDFCPESTRLEASQALQCIISASTKRPGPLKSEAIRGGEGGIRTHGNTI